MEIYIDGSCRPKSRFGGYGILIIDDKGQRTVISDTQEDVTNNIMELLALIEALKYIKQNQLDELYEIEIFSDSQYVVLGLTQWMTKWKANGYKTSTGEDIKNIGLWKTLDKLAKSVRCKLTWIKGHANNRLHNEVDELVFNLTAKKKNEIVSAQHTDQCSFGNDRVDNL